MERIYHRYEFWECYKNGFFRNVSGDEKKKLANKVIELFTDSKLTEKYMNKVIDEWKYSCEHNLTNISLNRIAWLGQSACCLYANIPYSITMENWRFVEEEKRNIACEIAEKIIAEYERKNNQLCLKFI
jgi:16S rRNA A1518/A1519 N6-dimethyltransferase RsmA/KsgA/DIM1 with predicted DNA glycosylase/AP lyase activity